jgi:hypothetical protein
MWGRMQREWRIATEYYPDLINLNLRLSILSEQVASEFRTKLLETKQFNNRKQLVEQLEGDFLIKNFGRNQEIVEYGCKLMQWGNRTAAAELQRIVAVLGSKLDPELIIARVQSKHPDAPPKTAVPPRAVSDIAKRLLRTQYVTDAVALIDAIDGRVAKTRTGLFGEDVLILQLGESTLQFETDYEMTQWLIKEVVPTLIAQPES